MGSDDTRNEAASEEAEAHEIILYDAFIQGGGDDNWNLTAAWRFNILR